MNRLSAQQRDLIAFVLLLIILLLAFPLLGSLFADHIPASTVPRETPTEQSMHVPGVTFFQSRHLNSLAMSHFFSATGNTGDTEKKNRVFSVSSVRWHIFESPPDGELLMCHRLWLI